jgi:hypothetical protein
MHFPFFLESICPAHLIPLDLIDLITVDEGYNYEILNMQLSLVFGCLFLYIPEY